jgi:oxygen-dependent protoporphyrinogen oxidase
MIESASYVIVGGGLPSLIFASLLSKRDPSKSIVIIEGSDQVGGLFKSTQTDIGDTFDQGMHIYYETEIEEVDRAFLDILPVEEWQYLEGNRKDVAGIFYNGKLQLDTPYPDLRGYSKENKMAYFQSLFQHKETHTIQDFKNVFDLLIVQFGEVTTSEIIEPILKKLYNLNGKDLDPIAFRLTAINRIALFSKEIVEELMKSEYLRARIAYPDQLRLKYERESSSRGIYPKKFGFGKVITKLTEKLMERGVLFLFNTRIKELEIQENRINYLICNDEKETKIKIEKGIIWSADVFSLLKSMNVKIESKIKIEQKRYVNIILRHYPNMGDLYYFYNFDISSEIFRVTNFTAYCSDAANGNRFPICVEFWSKGVLTEDQIRSRTIDDLIQMSVIADSESVLYAGVSKLPILFPTPSVEAISSINDAATALAQKKIDNLVLTGALSSKNVFFLHEVLKNGYNSLVKKGWL